MARGTQYIDKLGGLSVCSTLLEAFIPVQLIILLTCTGNKKTRTTFELSTFEQLCHSPNISLTTQK